MKGIVEGRNASPERPFRAVHLAVIGSLLILSLLGLALYRNAVTGGISPFRPGGASDLHVLLITVDTLRADHLGCYGYAKAKTPHIDRLAAEGMLFTNASCQVPLTLPSHCSILTGTYPMYHGVRDNAGFHLEEGNVTLAEILHEHGYMTGGFVGTFSLDSRWGLSQGFDTYFDDFPISKYDVLTPERVQRKGEEVVDAVFRWWNRHRREKLFTWIHLFDPHTPYDAPAPYGTMFEGERLGSYDGEIAYTDMLIGRVLARLEETNLLDRTLIVFTGDHGEMLGEHGESTHGYFIYDAATRIPLIIRSPADRGRGRVFQSQVESVDIVPTVLEMLGIGPPVEVQGKSLVAEFSRDADEDEAAYAYSESHYAHYRYGWGPLRSLRTPRFKLIDAPRPELYDLTDDPDEERNIIASHPEIAARFENELAEASRRFTAGHSNQQGVRAVDEESLRGLRALGYLDATGLSETERRERAVVDPKDRIELYNAIMEAERKFSESDPDEALRSIHEVLAVEPNMKMFHVSAGILYVQKKEMEKAVEELKKAIAIDPGFELALFHLAQAYMDSGRWSEAVAGFEKVAELDPYDTKPLLHIANIHIQKGELESAIVALNRAVRINPELPEAHFDLGLLHGRLGRHAEAIEALKRALAIQPDLEKAHFYMGLAYGLLGRREEERQALQNAVRRDPGDANAHYLLGVSYFESGQKASAMDEHRILQALDPELAGRLLRYIDHGGESKSREKGEASP